MTVSAVFDAAGRRRSPRPCGLSRGTRAAQQGQLYVVADVEEMIAVMREAVNNCHGWRCAP